LKGNKPLASSPNPSQKMLNSSKKLFSIKPFNLETSTQATTSHSMRKQRKENTTTDGDSPTDSFKIDIESVRQLWDKDTSPTTKESLDDTKRKITLDPIKINVRWKRTNLNKIKLKFKRHNQDANLFNSSKIVCYSTQPVNTNIIRDVHTRKTLRKTAYFGK